jgi:hypothetical protein
MTKKAFYEVIYQDEDDIRDNQFRIATLTMCDANRNCGCFKKGQMDTCDYMFTNTEDLAIAEDKYKMLMKEGYKHVWIKDTTKGVIVRGV